MNIDEIEKDDEPTSADIRARKHALIAMVRALEADKREAVLYASKLSGRIIDLEADKAGLVEALKNLSMVADGAAYSLNTGIMDNELKAAIKALAKHGGKP